MFLKTSPSRLVSKLSLPRAARKKVSLSTYFPNETQYFYGYPAGEDSGFLNKVTPKVEELVAARAFSCAGQNVTIVGFAATNTPNIDEKLLYNLNIPHPDEGQMTILPEEIDSSVHGAERNERIKDALVTSIPAKSLVMAQPYSGDEIAHIYQIPPKLTKYLNDKSTMEQYFRKDLLPERYGAYENGTEFAKATSNLPLPVVIKATSSSAGDGVYLCRTKADLKRAIKELRPVSGSIIVEQYIDVRTNYGLHFGIPCAESLPIDILGVNEQLTTSEGEFIGGIIESRDIPEELIDIVRYVQHEVLPKIRSMGWYGVGGFDVLADQTGQFYFIDCNFRMTGMSAYHFLAVNDNVKTPLMSFGGQFTGSQAELEACLLPYAGRNSKNKIMQVIAISRHEDTWDFNAAVFFSDRSQLKKRIKLLLSLGIASPALEQMVDAQA